MSICDQDCETYSELYEEIDLSSVYLPPIFAKNCLVSSFKFPLVDNETNIYCSSDFDVNNDDSSDCDDELIVGKKYLLQKEQLNKNSCQKIPPGPEESKFRINFLDGLQLSLKIKSVDMKELSKKFLSPSEKSQPSIIDDYKTTSRSEALIFDYIYHPLSNLMVSCNCPSGVT